MSLENYPNFLLNFSEGGMNGEETHFYRFKSFRLNVEERQLLHNGDTVALTPKAFDVLVALVERNGHLVEKDELLRIVWADSFVEEANIARIVHTLRKVLGDDGNGNKFIETVAKKGYRFVAEVLEINKTKSPVSKDDEIKPQIPKPANAYQAYQIARYHFQQLSPTDIIKSRSLLEEAVRFDADFAIAHAALAEQFVMEGMLGLRAPLEIFPKAKDALRRAAELNPHSTEFYTAAGFVDLICDFNFTQAEVNLRKALELNPHNALANNYLGQTFMFRCQPEQAELYLRRAVEIEPMTFSSGIILAIAYFLGRNYQMAIEQCEKMLAVYPHFFNALWMRCCCWEQTGRAAEAIAEYEKILREPDGELVRRWMGYAYALVGDTVNALATAARVETERQQAYFVSPTHLAALYAALKDTDKAISYLEDALEKRDPWMLWIGTDPRYDNLRGDSRFDELLRCVGLKNETVAKKGYRFVAGVQVSENYLINQTFEHSVKNGDGLAIESATQTNEFIESEFVYKNEDEVKNRSIGKRKLSRKFITVCLGIVLIASVLSLGFYKFSKTAKTAEPFRQINLSRLTNYGNVGKVALSPDGNLIVYETDDKDGVSLWVRQIEISNPINLVPPKKGNYTFLTFSPDGKLVYYGFFSGDKIAAQFYSVPALGGASRKLPIVVTTSMSFAPDGNHFAHITTDSGAGEKILLISRLDGGDEIQLAKSKMPLSFNVEGQSCAWSPDGKTIAVIKNNTDAKENFSTVVGISPADGAEKPLSAKHWNSLNSVQWLKNESGLLVIGSDTPQGANQIWFVSAADGEARMLTNDLNDYSYVGAAADGKQFVSVQESRASSVWLGAVGQNSNDFKELISETGKLDSIVSTANGNIVFRSNAGGNSNLWTIGADGKKRQISVDGQVDERGLCAAPDGKKIVFPSRQAGKVNLWSMAVDGGEMKQLTDGDGEFYPVCTPDNSSVIYQKGYGFGVRSTLWKTSLEGGEPVRLTDYFAMRPTLSPDGSHVAFFYMVEDKWRIGLVSSGGGAIEQSLDVPDGVSDRLMRWSPDAQSLLYMSNAGETGNIWRLPLDGQPPQQVTNFDSQMVEDFFLTPNGRQIFVTRTTALSDVINVSEK